MAKVSVIIPSYKSELYLAQAIESALSQQSKDVSIECIVVDDGSPENDSGVAEKYIPQITLIRQKNQGVSAARNNGFKVSTGEFICFLDADDILEPNAISQRLAVIRQNEQFVMVHGPATHVDPQNIPIDFNWKWPVGEDASGDLLPKLFEFGFIIFSTMLIRRQSFIEAGGFDEGYKIHASEDLILWLRLALCGPIGYVPQKTLRYRVLPNSASRNTKVMELGELYARLRFISTHPAAAHRLGYQNVKKKLISQAEISGARLEKTNYFQEALMMYISTLKRYPLTWTLYKPLARSLFHLITQKIKSR
jgi:glycosyltransferase involved in cell wall biosynthesis